MRYTYFALGFVLFILFVAGQQRMTRDRQDAKQITSAPAAAVPDSKTTSRGMSQTVADQSDPAPGWWLADIPSGMEKFDDRTTKAVYEQTKVLLKETGKFVQALPEVDRLFKDQYLEFGVWIYGIDPSGKQNIGYARAPVELGKKKPGEKVVKVGFAGPVATAFHSGTPRSYLKQRKILLPARVGNPTLGSITFLHEMYHLAHPVGAQTNAGEAAAYRFEIALMNQATDGQFGSLIQDALNTPRNSVMKVVPGYSLESYFPGIALEQKHGLVFSFAMAHGMALIDRQYQDKNTRQMRYAAYYAHLKGLGKTGGD